MQTSAVEEFQGPNGAIIATNHPTVKTALVRLGEAWPRALSFSELLRAGSDHGPTPAAASTAEPARGEAAQALGEFLLRAYAMDFVELHSLPSPFVTEVSERPLASRLARWQIQPGSMVSTLRHAPLKIEDSLGQNLLRLLDGTRDRAALVEALEALLR